MVNRSLNGAAAINYYVLEEAIQAPERSREVSWTCPRRQWQCTLNQDQVKKVSYVPSGCDPPHRLSPGRDSPDPLTGTQSWLAPWAAGDA